MQRWSCQHIVGYRLLDRRHFLHHPPMSPRDVRNENPNHHHDFYQLGDPTFVHGDLYFLPSRKIWQFNQSSNGDGGMSFELFHGKIWHFARANK